MKHPAMLHIASAVVCAVAAFGVVAQDKKAPAAPAPAAKDAKPAAAPAAPAAKDAKPAAAPAAPAADGHVAYNQGDLKWGDAPPSLPKGAKVAVLNGDPGKAGAFAIMAKFPAGYKVPPHFHGQDENVTVISGTMMFGTGDKIDDKSAHTVKAGGYAYMPAKMHHYAVAKSESVIEVAGMGPFEVTYVNSSDDPRNAAPAAAPAATPKKEEKKK